MLRPPSYYKCPESSNENETIKKSSLQQTDNSTFKPVVINNAITSSPYDTTNNELREQIDLLIIELNRNELSYSTQIRELSEQIMRNLKEIQFIKSSQDQKDMQFLCEKSQIEDDFSREIEAIRAENDTALEKIREFEILLSNIESEKHEMEQEMSLTKEENIRLKLSLDSITTYPDREEGYKISIDELETQLNHGAKQTQFLNLRLEALQDILKLQEKNMVENSTESCENVLATWRGKVFELLMHEKIIKYDFDRSQKLISNEFKGFTERITQLENESELQKLCINEKCAQVDSLNEEIRLVNSNNSKLSSCIIYHQQSQKVCKVNLLITFTQLRSFSDTIDILCSKKLTALTTLHHRIMFLSERVGFLVGYLTHNQSRLKPQREFAVQTSFPDSCLGQNNSLSCERIISLSHGTLVNEVQLLVRERSILQNKLKDNSDIAMRKIQSICEDVNLEKENLLSEISELNNDRNKIIAENEIYREDLEMFKLDSEKKAILINDLECEIVENNRKHEQQRKEILEDLQTRHSESLKDLDNRMKEMCENYTEQQERARIAENNTQREVELAVRSFQIENQDLQRKLEEMRIHLQAVESEKKMLSRSLQLTATPTSNPVPPTQIPPPPTKEFSMQTDHAHAMPAATRFPEQNISHINKEETNHMTLALTKEKNETTSNQMVAASEFYLLLQDITELSSQVLSM